MIVQLREPNRQAVRVGIVLAVVRDALVPQFEGPRAKREIAFESRTDIPELAGSAERRHIGSDDDLAGAGSNRLPDTREIGLSIGSPWRRCVEPDSSVRRARRTRCRVRRPLRRKRRRNERDDREDAGRTSRSFISHLPESTGGSLASSDRHPSCPAEARAKADI